MGTVAAGPAARSHSAFVFWTLVALVVCIGLAGQLLGPGSSSQPQRAEGEAVPLPLVEEPTGTLTADWPIDDQAAKAAGLGVAPPDASSVASLRDALVAADTTGTGGVTDGAARPVDGALIVRTGSLELEVEDVAASLASARREVAALGGYVAGSDEYDQGESRWATVTYRVPVKHFGDAIARLRDLSDRVVHESTQSAEVTASVVDLLARISNLRASEQALVEIMDRAGRIDDVLSVQLRLEDVRGRIEQLEAQRSDLADQAALSTLTVAWSTPVAAVSVVQESWDAASEVDRALAQTVEALQGLASAAIWFGVVVLPLVIVPVSLLLVAIVLLRRRARPVPAAE